MSTKRVAFTVQGLVQGVNYRNFAVQRAVADGVTGWVKNAQDGPVVGEAQADDPTLKKFIKELYEGPPMAEVKNVEQKELTPKADEDEFQQRR
ncbi:Acylphosphatase-like domain-containing protein [Schizophyllum amplum]|uniref:acylphosphatase n=1 Tax=Schizophyllum amplum TaxID=97359 RepID=A0A550CKA1_9AGAR|nr:Acylphosphatase-like domain-containing protein [Auriculariopsis ampla]